MARQAHGGDRASAASGIALNASELLPRPEREHGRRYWRSLEELADSPDFLAVLAAEFPSAAPRWTDPVGRRRFLQLMAASLALAGAGGCTRQPAEKIYPYAKAPEQLVPGEPLYFATAMPLMGFGTGLLVESHLGRPTKVEGNPEHPASLGATGVFAQASVLTLYDPDRSQVITSAGEIRPWAAFAQLIREILAAQRGRRGAGLRLLTGTVTSPTLAHQIQMLMAELPEAHWHQYEPLARDQVRRGLRLAFAQDVDVRYRFDRARVVLSLDADFLMHDPGNVRYTRDFCRGRRPEAKGDEVHRLYVVEPTPSNTGAMADHRLPSAARQIEWFARAIAARLGLPVTAPSGTDGHQRWVEAVAHDLQAHRGASLVVAGEFQPPAVHVLAHAMNQALGNDGHTVVYTEPVEAKPDDHIASLRALLDAADGGAVEVLLILGTNPVLTAPVDLRFAERLSKVPLRIHLGLYHDETAELCHWHVPEAHFLESWSDVRAFDGTTSIIQPLIAPLYEGRTAHEVLALLADEPSRSSYEIVRDYWKGRYGREDFERFWRRSVHDGRIPESEVSERPVTLRSDWVERINETEAPAYGSAGGIEIVFRPDPSLLDGSLANNAWLQELPRPITKLTWDNAALLAPATAARLGVANEDVVELNLGGRVVKAPVWVVPGQAEECVTVHLGHGRWRAGRVGNGSGFNAYALRASDTPWFASGLMVRPTGRRHPLACTQHHHVMEGRDLIRVVRQGEHSEHAARGHAPGEDKSLHPAHPYEGYAWGMAIDLNACIGCNACVIACQSENNIAVVGKSEVRTGREMHWIRIDRYYEGSADAPSIYHQPVPCMHCERAPCEVVCPVNATVHSDEGLNDMVYNRCVGTRYCANNCPYKVRRFNFRLYSDWHTEPLKMLANPDVTVRSRGVMEKCTYCVQRINYARIRAKLEDRKIRDGEVVTACQAVCPAEAIVFGDINEPGSRVAAERRDPRHYALLAELGTEPRTTYLAAVRNPNPDLDDRRKG
jgi:MoCo/4Fe-4S cofactor protein with predicted Tat translocation signal